MHAIPRLLRAPSTIGLTLILAGTGCGDTVGTLESATPGFAKGGPGSAGPSVTAVDPSYGHKGETVTGIRITGSGFDQTAIASWERNGVPDPAITVLATRFVSSSQVEADILIGANASVALYDVAITLAGGKRGVGIESYEVTTAETLGPDGPVYDVSEAGLVTGYAIDGSCCTATVYETGVGVTALGSGQAWALDPLGTMVLGRDGAFKAAAWLRQEAGSYLLELLPGASGSTGGLARTAERASNGDLLVAGADAVPAGTRKNSGSVNRAAVWRHTGLGWSGPEIYATPSGMSGSTIRSINAAGQAVGVANGQSVGVIWKNATEFSVVDGLPDGINPAGTVVVGQRSGLPVYWWRNASTDPWTTIPLPTLGGTCQDFGGAQSINAAGIIVGLSCNSRNVQQATVWQLDLSGPIPVVSGAPLALPGLGEKSAPSSVARAITETMPYVIAGTASYKGKTLWVRWVLSEE